MTTRDNVIGRILERSGGPVHSTKLVKLVYLVDYLYYQNFGTTITGFTYMWDHYGPNAVGNGIIEEAGRLVRSGALRVNTYPNSHGGHTVDYSVAQADRFARPPTPAELIIGDVLAQYGSMSVEEITQAAKKTAPFQSAVEYGRLNMTQIAEVHAAEAGEWEAFVADLKTSGVTSLDDVRRMCGLA